MKPIVYYSALIMVVLSSCHSVKHATKDPELQTVSSQNIHLLKGTYHNQPIDDKLNKAYSSVYDVNALQDVQLLKQFFLLKKTENGIAEQLQIAIINNELQITAMQDGQTVKQFRIKGKFRKGYFKTKKESKTKFPPLPPFYYFNENVRLYLTLDTANNLVVKRKGRKTGMIFFFAAGFKMDNEYCYPPYNNTTPQTDSVIKGDEQTNSFLTEEKNTAPKLSGDAATDKKLQPVIDKINRINAGGEQYEKISTDLDIGGEGGTATFYSKNDAVLLIEKVEYGETFRTEKDYYFDDKSGDLIYMTERHYRYNRPIYYDEKAAKENNDTEAFDESSSTILTYHNYFENGKLFYRVNKNNEPEKKNELDKTGNEILKELEKMYK